MVSRLPVGRSVQPSSSFSSCLPVPVAVQVTGLRLVRIASCVVQQLASIILPLGNTTLWASPTVLQPVGAASEAHVLVCGLYVAPRVVQTGPPLLYSPPMMTTWPVGRT